MHENLSHQPTSVDYKLSIVFDDSEPFEETGTIRPMLDASVGAEWKHIRTDDGVLACIDLYVQEDSTTNISLPDLGDEWLPFLWLDGEAGLSKVVSSDDTFVCLNGVDSALPFHVQSLVRSVDVGNLSFMVGFDATWPHIVSSSNQGWLIDGTHEWGAPFNQGGTLYQQNASSCPDTEFLKSPPRSDNNNWSWDLSIRPKHRIPSVEGNESLHLKLPSDTFVYCNQEDAIATTFAVQSGPDLILYQNNETLRLWDGPMTVETSQLEFSLYNSNEDDVVLRHDSYGDVAWDLTSLPNLLSSGWNNFTLDVPESMFNTYQFTHQDGAILVTFGAYMGA